MSREDNISIEGTLLMMDNVTPHTAVHIQAVLPGKKLQVAANTLSDENGRYRFVDLKPGTYRVRCYTLNGYVYYGEDKMANEANAASLQVQKGRTLKDVDFRFAPIKKGTWRTITHFDGLCSNFVSVMYQDPDGKLWFGTYGGGVSWYDGREFISFAARDGLADNHVYGIYRDPYGILWFGTLGGVSRYDGKKFVNFTERDGLIDNRVLAICDGPNGTLWFGTSEGISRYDGDKFVNFTTENGLSHNMINAIHRDPDGNLWFGTGNRRTSIGGGVSCYDGEKFITLTTQDGLANDVVSAIGSDPDGTMWFGTSEGVSRYDGRGFTNFTIQDGLANNLVKSICRDRDGILWFGTGTDPSGAMVGNGVSRYDGEGFVNFTTSDGLAHNSVPYIHQTQDGALWFATASGVSRYDEKGIINLTTRDGLAQNHILAIHRDSSGDLWLGTNGGGVSRYDGEGIVNLTTRDGLVHNAVRAVGCDLDGVLWFGTNGGGVSRYDGEKFTTLTTRDGLADNQVWAIHCDRKGIMWFGTGIPFGSGGVSCYYEEELATLNVEDGLEGICVWAIHEDHDGALWFGTNNGVYRYDGQTFINLTDKDGLVNNSVPAVGGGPDGIIWLGTLGSGISRYDSNSFATFTSSDGLAYDLVWSIYHARDGTVWFGTRGGGVSRYDGTVLTSLDMRDGLAGNTIEAIHEDPDGSLWFGTDGGLTHYYPSTVPPHARIVAVTTDQRYTDLDAIPPATVGTRITFQFSSIDFRTHPDKRLYCYRLGEYEADWNPPTRETEVDYTDVPAGEYTFYVQAIDRDGNYSEPVTVDLTVQPDPVLVSMQTELDHLRRGAGMKYQFEDIIGRSHGIRQVRALMERAIDSGLTVLIIGETGTGKELVAKAIHYNSPRKDYPLLDRNCGAMPRELLASDLFGHRRGAFTGANEDKIGLFEAASGGTLLLDEIGDMPQGAQIHLLRVLEERKIQRLGENVSRDVDARIIAMTNRDLITEVMAHRFREDLYYRLSEFPIHIPPLRDRIEDIPLLAEHFLAEIDKPLDGFAPGVLGMLQNYSWPGNVRELRNAVRRASALVEEGERIQVYHFHSQITQGESLIQDILSERVSYSESLERFRRRLVEKALRECNGNRTHAAKILGMNRPNLIKLINRLGIDL